MGKYILDGSKILWHQDRLNDWCSGKKIAPITIDMALTRACNFRCLYCYSKLQENKSMPITFDVMRGFLDDCADMRVKGISFVSDGESTINPCYVNSIVYGYEKGLSMAIGTNGYLTKKPVLEKILPCLTYFRVNISAAEPQRYSEIMGVPVSWYDTVIQNIKGAVEAKRKNNLDVTIGLQMVLRPEYEDQIIPLAKLGRELRVDYLVIKHCSDDEEGTLGVDYSGYKEMYESLKEAETYAKSDYQVAVKWSKIKAEGRRTYERCYAPPLHLQISGSGLVAPCGMLFNEKYKKYHIGNFVETRFKEIVLSDRYWDVMGELASDKFNAKKMCGCLCLQHKSNEILDVYKKGNLILNYPKGTPPKHINFI